MSRVLDRFSRPVTLHTVVQTIVNFHPVNAETNTDIKAVVQPANKKKINPATIDWSLDYKLMHSKETTTLNDNVTVDGVKYKIVEVSNYSAYGYHESILEEIT